MRFALGGFAAAFGLAVAGPAGAALCGLIGVAAADDVMPAIGLDLEG